MEHKYSIIVFDLGNTLVRFDHSIAVKRLARRFSIDRKTAYDLFFDSELTHLFEKGLISPAEFHKDASKLLGINMSRRDFEIIWNDIFWEDKASCALARKLKKRYKLYLLSNTNRCHFNYIRKKFKIIEIFDRLVLSYLVGAMKPDRKIFEHVVKLSGGDRSRLLYIDDREDLIKEARALGIDSIRFEGAVPLKKELVRIGVLPASN